MSDFSQYIKRIGLVGITQFIVTLQGFVLLPILTKNMNIEYYGIWAQLMVTIGVIPNIVVLGLPYTMVRYLPALDKKEQLQDLFYTILSLVLVVTSLFSLLVLLLAPVIGRLLFGGVTFVAEVLSAIVFFECLNLFFVNYLRAKQYIKKYSLTTIIKTLILIIIVGYFVSTGKGIEGAVIGLLTADIILFLILISITYIDIGFKVPSFVNTKEYLNFGIPTIPGNLSKWIVNSSDRYVIGVLLSVTFVGYYTPGYTVGNLIIMFLTPFSFLLPSILSEYFDRDRFDDVKNILSYSYKYYLTVSIPAVFGVSILSKSLLALLTTPEITMKGWMITPMVALGTLFFGCYSFMHQILILEKKTYVIAKIWVICAVLNISLNFILVPYTGIVGASFTTLLAFVLAYMIASYSVNNDYKFDRHISFTIKSVLSSIIMSIFILQRNPSDMKDIIIQIIVGSAIYFICLIMLKGFSKKEYNFITKYVRI
jgi:O-antigen/teichoic acid export membrane protein